MSFRELDYMTRLILREAGSETPDKAPRLHSVVLYIGQGAGREDTGRYEILGLNGEPCLIWRYTPIRLWQIDADELLALGSTAFLPLVGQTQIREPAQVIPAVVESIHNVADELQRRRLMTALVNLISDEEIIAMIEQIIDPTDEYFMDLPYMRRIRQKARTEGVQVGQQEGVLEGLRAAVLNVLVLRFNPPAKTYLQCQRQLQEYTDQERLQRLLAAAVQSEDMDAFLQQMGAEQANGHI